MAVLHQFARHGLGEEFLGTFGDWTWFSGADRSIVDFADGRHLGGGAGKEELVGPVKVTPSENGFFHFDPLAGQQFHHRCSGDAIENPRTDRRGDDRSITDQEEILPGALGDIAVHVEQERLVVPRGQCFLFGQNAVEILAGPFGNRNEAGLVNPAPAGDPHPDPVGHTLFTEVGAPSPGRDDGADSGGSRVEADGAQLVENEGADVARLEFVCGYDLAANFYQLVNRPLELDAVSPGRSMEAFDVLAQAKDGGPVRGLICPDALEHAGAVMEGVAENVDVGICEGDQVAVHPNELGRIHGKRVPGRGCPVAGNQNPETQRPRQVKKAAIVVGVLLAACGTATTPTTTAEPGLGIEGDWELLEGTVAGMPIPEGDFRVTLLFKGGTVGGVAACNSYGGEYTADDGFLRFGLMYQTEMACAEPAMSAENTFMDALSRVDSYEIAGEQLTLSGADVTLVFAVIPPIETAPFFEQRWTLESLIQHDAVSSVQGDGFLLLTEEGALTGSTGCRDLSGVFIVVADEIVPTDFGAEGDCAADLGQQDSHFISVIEGGFNASVNEDRLTLMNADGNGLQFRAEG